MSVPVEMTAVAGAILTTVQWNSNVRNGINFLVNTKPLTIVRQNSAQNVTNATWTAITWDTEILVRDGMHSTSVNPTRITANTGGYYNVVSQLAWAASSTGYRNSRFSVSGFTIQMGSGSQATNTAFHSQTLANFTYLNAGDYIELYGNQGSGGTLATAVLSDGTSLMSVEWISTA